jgi:PAS domain S-box-containing protein
MVAWLFGSSSEPARRRSDLPEPPPRDWPRLWLPGVIIGTLAVVALLILPADEPASDFVFLSTALVSLVVLLGAPLTMTANGRSIWWWLFAFQALTMAAVAVQAFERESAPAAVFPSAADVVFLTAYLPALVALGLLIHRTYPGRDREAWIDSAILTVTATCVIALFVIVPIAGNEQLSGWATVVAIAYPLLDIVLLGLLMWLLVGSTRRTVTLGLIATSVLITLATDITRDVLLASDPTGASSAWLGVLRLAALIAMTAAAWTPTAESFAQPETRGRRPISTGRLAVLAIGVLAVPAIVAYRLYGTDEGITLLLALAGMIVIILAVLRIQILVSAVEHQRRVTELVLDSAGDGIVGLDREGFVLFANLSARRMLRCRESDLIGHRFHDIAHHEHPDGSSYPWQECPVHSSVTSEHASYLPEQRYIRRDGTAFPVEIVMSPLVVEGVVTGAVQSFRDVSEREEMEEIKRQFVSVVSHELRTPLTSIKGSLQMLDSGLLGPLEPDQQELVSMAVANADRLGNLVNDILDLERLDAGRMPLEPARVSATDLAQQAVAGIHGAAEAAGVRLSLELPEGPAPDEVLVDPHRLLQVLTNLLGNAIKFSERGSTVTVAVTTTPESVGIAVADHGRGIPADQLASVFDRFGQVESGDARREGGTGLGLAIAKEITERSEGSLTVASTVGVGSTFTVRLPVPAGATEDAAPESPPLAEDTHEVDA